MRYYCSRCKGFFLQLYYFLTSSLPNISGKSFLVDHGGPERSWSTTQHHGPAGAPGPPLDHLDSAWTTSCNHTPEIAVQGGSRWTRGTTGTMELGGGPGALWSHFYILLMDS